MCEEPISADLHLERFDYSRVGELAVTRLVIRPVDGIGLPTAPILVVDGHVSSPARVSRTERRLHRRALGDAGTLLWRGVFAVPAELAIDPAASWWLVDGDDAPVVLPAPSPRTLSARGLALAPAPLVCRRSGSLGIARSRRRVAAVATAAALTATSAPATALAAAATTSSTAHPHRLPAAAATIGGGSAVSAQAATVNAGTTTSTPVAAAPTPTTPTTTASAATTSTATTATSPVATTATSTTPASTSTTATVPAATTPATPSAPTTTTTTTTTTSTSTTPTTVAPVVTAVRAGGHHHRLPATTVTKLPGAVHHRDATPRRHHRDAQPPSFPTPTLPAPTTSRARERAAHRAESRRESAARRRIDILSAGVRQAAAEERARRAEARAAAHARALAATPRFSTTAGAAGGVHLLGSEPGYDGPTSWTGVVDSDPGLTGAVRNLSGLLSDADRPPSFLIPIYMRAAKRYHLPWPVLAAINAIETDYGRDLNTSSAGAVGWMQFEPSTWKRYGVAADGVSEADPYDPRDAIFAAARYLAAAGGAEDIRRAVFAYNHADWYVDEVMTRAQAIARHVQYAGTAVGHRGVISVDFATDLKGHPKVHYRSGWLSHYDRLIAAANMVSAADFPYLWGGGHEPHARFGPFDCSGSVSYVMQQAGYRVPTTVAADIGGWGFPTGPGRVTIFYDAVHTFMRIGDRYFGTSGFARPGGGAGWFDVNRLPAGYLAQFSEVHVPELGLDSFAPHSDAALIRAERVRRVRKMTVPRISVFRTLARDSAVRLRMLPGER